MKAATTLTAPVISVRDETLIHRRFSAHLSKFFSSIFPLGSVAAWHCLLVCVCALAQTGWAGRGHGSPARLDPSRGTKQGERRSSAKPPEIKDQVWDWDSLQKAGPILVVQGVSGRRRRRRRRVKNNNQIHHRVCGPGRLGELAEASACSVPPRLSPLKSACFCSLHNLI